MLCSGLFHVDLWLTLFYLSSQKVGGALYGGFLKSLCHRILFIRKYLKQMHRMLRINNQGHEHTGNIVYESWSMCEDIFLFKRFILINSDNYLFEVVLGLKKIRQRHREVK